MHRRTCRQEPYVGWDDGKAVSSMRRKWLLDVTSQPLQSLQRACDKFNSGRNGLAGGAWRDRTLGPELADARAEECTNEVERWARREAPIPLMSFSSAVVDSSRRGRLV